ncbi:hypothetical protein K7432_005127 [Basidiobolus ranarum]|uniref:Uncharacterized protein n=1 Tax=Basidiobolus ranarum TaxID=34480 RepID=A0ABR2W3K6_9FUNG
MLATHFLDGIPSQDYTIAANSGAAMGKTQVIDKATEEYIRISETEIVTKINVLHNLHGMGQVLFNNPYSTNTCLHINDEHGETATFWVHDFYFVRDSPVLFRALHRSPHLNTHLLEDLEYFNPKNEKTTADCNGKWHIHLSVP